MTAHVHLHVGHIAVCLCGWVHMWKSAFNVKHFLNHFSTLVFSHCVSHWTWGSQIGLKDWLKTPDTQLSLSTQCWDFWNLLPHLLFVNARIETQVLMLAQPALCQLIHLRIPSALLTYFWNNCWWPFRDTLVSASLSNLCCQLLIYLPNRLARF